jgi:hypothetical protein
MHLDFSQKRRIRAFWESMPSAKGIKVMDTWEIIRRYHDEQWTNQQQMTVNGKRDNFTIADLLEPAKQFGIKNANNIIQSVITAVKEWPMIAEKNKVPEAMIEKITKTQRLNF